MGPLLMATLALLVVALPGQVAGRMAFEKLTDFDFPGNTYYSVKNLSLYECQGWCREEPDCQAAAFSFVVNPLSPHRRRTASCRTTRRRPILRRPRSAAPTCTTW